MAVAAGELDSVDEIAVIVRQATRAAAAGKARIEGKDYVMRDGDVVEFRFNV